MFTANEMATAVRHRIPLTAIVFNDGAFGNVRRIQEERYGNRLIASDLANPDFVHFAESFGAAAERARTPEELRAALKRGFARRDGPTLIEVPVGPLPSPWEFILMPRVRGEPTGPPPIPMDPVPLRLPHLEHQLAAQVHRASLTRCASDRVGQLVEP